MAIDTFSPNRNYVLPATGNDVNTWGPLLNGNFSAIDSNISALLTVATTGGTTTLTAGQAANLYYNVNGALTSNAILTFPGVIQTFFIVTNNTTGMFTLTIQTANIGTTQVLGQGASALYYSDGTNIILVAGTVPPAPIPVLIVTTATTLTTAQNGFLVELSGTTAFTTTIPASGSNPGLSYKFFAFGAIQTIVATSGVFGGPNGSGTSTLTLANGATVNVESDGGNYIVKNLTLPGGYALLAGSSTQAFSVAPAAAPTQAPQFGQILGANAAWNNVTTSRAFSTLFTNNNGKPISVSVVALNSTNAANALDFFVNGVLIGATTSSNNSGNPMGGNFIVPAGANYVVAPSNAASLDIWFELF